MSLKEKEEQNEENISQILPIGINVKLALIAEFLKSHKLDKTLTALIRETKKRGTEVDREPRGLMPLDAILDEYIELKNDQERRAQYIRAGGQRTTDAFADVFGKMQVVLDDYMATVYGVHRTNEHAMYDANLMRNRVQSQSASNSQASIVPLALTSKRNRDQSPTRRSPRKKKPVPPIPEDATPSTFLHNETSFSAIPETSTSAHTDIDVFGAPFGMPATSTSTATTATDLFAPPVASGRVPDSPASVVSNASSVQGSRSSMLQSPRRRKARAKKNDLALKSPLKSISGFNPQAAIGSLLQQDTIQDQLSERLAQEINSDRTKHDPPDDLINSFMGWLEENEESSKYLFGADEANGGS